MIKEIKKIFKSRNKICSYKNRQKSYGSKTVYRFQINSTKISDYLKGINAFGDKDHRNPFSFIPDEYKLSFIKGYFDGDGCVYRNEIIIDGRKELISEIYNWMCNKLNLNKNKIYQHSLSDKTFEIRFNGKDAIKVAKAIKNNTNGSLNTDKIKKLYNII